MQGVQGFNICRIRSQSIEGGRGFAVCCMRITTGKGPGVALKSPGFANRPTMPTFSKAKLSIDYHLS